jgi:hypothetical protein
LQWLFDKKCAGENIVEAIHAVLEEKNILQSGSRKIFNSVTKTTQN